MCNVNDVALIEGNKKEVEGWCGNLEEIDRRTMSSKKIGGLGRNLPFGGMLVSRVIDFSLKLLLVSLGPVPTGAPSIQTQVK